MFTILFQDDRYVAIDKPPGWIIHRTKISEDTEYVLQVLRDQVGKFIFPIHRLDRPTSGVLLFGFDSEAAKELSLAIEAKKVGKQYIAIVRGYTEESGVIEIPLKRDLIGATQEASTPHRRIATAEIPIAVDRYPQSRYSLVEVTPQTGRMHQIRRHFSSIRHPIVGDKKHGDRFHNRMFRDTLLCDQMLLLARKLSFDHPFTGEPMNIIAEPQVGMKAMIDYLGWESEYRSL